MGLPARQRRALDRIEMSLRQSDPGLVAMFAIFGRLATGEAMPRLEDLRAQFVILFLRGRLWLRSVRWRGFRRGPARRLFRARQAAAVLFSAALVIMTIALVLTARLSNSPRCSAASTAAAARTDLLRRPGPAVCAGRGR